MVMAAVAVTKHAIGIFLGWDQRRRDRRAAAHPNGMATIELEPQERLRIGLLSEALRHATLGSH
jgi:hypothetical protein